MAIFQHPLVYSFLAALLLTAGREQYKLLEHRPDLPAELLLIAGFGIVFAIFKGINRHRSSLFIAATVALPTIVLSIVQYELLKLFLLQETQGWSYFTFRLLFNVPVLGSGIAGTILLLPLCLLIRRKETQLPRSSNLIDDGWLYE